MVAVELTGREALHTNEVQIEPMPRRSNLACGFPQPFLAAHDLVGTVAQKKPARRKARAVQQSADAVITCVWDEDAARGQAWAGELGVDFEPDLVAVGKALGAGMPVGAALVSERVAAAVSAGDHGSTYGGNLLACRAALVFLDALTEGGLQEHVRKVGGRLAAGLCELAGKHPVVREVRGAGLMWGLDLRVDAAPFVTAALDRGVLINRTSETVIRLLPPFVITAAEVDMALAHLDAVLSAGAGEHAA